MRRLSYLLLVLSLALALLLGACGQTGPQKFSGSFFGVFDTVVQVTGYADTREEFDRYLSLIEEEFIRYNQLFDIYKNYDNLNNLKTVNDNAGIAPVQVDSEIMELLSLCKTYYQQTDGLVNVAFGSVLGLWHDSREAANSDPDHAALPSESALAEAAQHCDMDNLVLDEAAGTVFLADPDMRLDVGAVAKGYATEKVARYAQQQGADSIVISAGGNVVAVGRPADGRDRWGIGVEDPQNTEGMQSQLVDTVYVSDMSVVCSGDYQRYFEVDGVRYHHIIDPRTLYPGTRYRQVTVLTKDSGTADMLSTALFLMDEQRGRQLLEQYGAQAIYIYADGSSYYTEGMEQYAESLGAQVKEPGNS